MSLLGKILSICVAVFLVLWIALAASVAKHHEGWSARIRELKAEVAALEPELPPLVAEADRNRDDATNLQVALERARLNFRRELALAQKFESDTKEDLARYQLQVALAEQEVRAAQARMETRTKERVDFEKSIEREKANVVDLQAANKARKDELAGLQKAFLDTVAENRSYAARLTKPAGPTPTGAAPRTRLGSFTR